MKLEKMTLENFACHKHLELEFGGNDAVISGANGLGKTTIANSLLWLLTGKGTDQKSYSPKPLSLDGKEVHNLDCSVEVEFTDGLTLKKVLVEKWQKKRGTLNKEHTGNTDKYYINGVPTKAREYSQKVAELIGSEDILKILSNPYYFASVMPWQKRREVLLGLSGDVSTKEVLKANPKLRELEGPLTEHSVDDYMKVINETLRDINRDIESLPARIDEQSRMMPDITNLDLVMLKSKRKEIEGQGRELLEKKKALQRNDDLSEAQRKMNELKLKRSERQSKLQGEYHQLESQLVNLKHRHESLSEPGRLEKVKGRQAELEFQLDILKKQDVAEVVDFCETCGQRLPADALEDVRLKQVGRTEKALAEIFYELQGIAGRSKEREGITAQMSELEPKMLALDEKINTPDKKMLALDEKIRKLKLKDNTAEIAKISAERDELKAQYSQLTADIQKFTDAGKINARIEELTREESKMVENYEFWDAKKFMLENFIRAKVEMLDKRVIRALGIKGLGVKMFQAQLNGGLKQVCEMTYDGVPFGKVNRSRQIQVGLLVIEVLAKHWNIDPVVFVDNAECVNLLPELDYQVIELVVSKAEKLKVVKK